MMPSRTLTVPPLFCGDESPADRGLVCTLDAYHRGGHLNQPTLKSWPNLDACPPTERPARVIPDTIPEMQLADRSCYFCGEAAGMIVNEDIPTCGRHAK